MKVKTDTIWRVPVYLPYLQPDLTDTAIHHAEKVIGYVLPNELLEILRKQNGGYIRYKLPESVHECIAGIGPYFPSLLHVNWEDEKTGVSFPLDGLVPFDGDGHWHICLDYRSDPTCPSVAYIDIECDSQRQIATSFADYLGKLQLPVDDELVVDSIKIEDLVNKLGEVMLAPFEPPDLWAHGYPIYRALLGKKRKTNWIWIAPNQVKRGFVREDDPRFEELKNRLPGLGLRFPELSATSLIVRVSQGAREKVVQALDSLDIQVRYLKDIAD